jgi:ribosomal protein S17
LQVHDETELCKVGDVVRITACRPMSARKRFAVAEVLKKAFIQTDAPLPSETQ